VLLDAFPAVAHHLGYLFALPLWVLAVAGSVLGHFLRSISLPVKSLWLCITQVMQKVLISKFCMFSISEVYAMHRSTFSWGVIRKHSFTCNTLMRAWSLMEGIVPGW